MEVEDKDVKINGLIKLGTIRVHDVDGSNEGVKNALSCFEQAIALDASNPDIYIHRAQVSTPLSALHLNGNIESYQIYLLTDQVEEAKNDLEKCCALDESFPSAVAQKLYIQFRFAVRAGLQDETESAFKGNCHCFS